METGNYKKQVLSFKFFSVSSYTTSSIEFLIGLIKRFKLCSLMSDTDIQDVIFQSHYPVGVYLLKINNKSTGTRCEICSKLTNAPERQRRSGVFIVNFRHISHIVLVFLLLTLNMLLPAGYDLTILNFVLENLQ